MVHLDSLRAFLALNLHFLSHTHHERIAVHAFEQPLDLTAVSVEHLNLLADKALLLLRHLERLTQTSRTYLKLVVFLIAAQTLFDEAAQLHTVLYPHTVGMVYLHHDLIIRADFNIHKKIVLVLQPLFYNTFYDVFVYHI